MKFNYHGDLPPGNSVSFGIRHKSPIAEDGTFEVDDEAVAVRLTGREDDRFEPILDDAPYRVLQKVAADDDDVSGNLSEDDLRAALTGDGMESSGSDDDADNEVTNDGT